MRLDAAEGVYLERLRHARFTDAITLEQFEERVAHVLAGGHLDSRLMPVAEPPAGSALAATMRNGSPEVVAHGKGWRP